MYGFCECGCGEKTKIHKRNDPRDGAIKGEPKRYIQGHQNIGRVGARGPYKLLQYVIDIRTGCWNWILCTCSLGKYGVCYIGDGRSKGAHIVYYEAAKGPVPDGLELDHLCRNTLCVNPDHLEAVTRKVNNRRKPSLKLNPEKVVEIRDIFSAGGISKAQLARDYGVGVTTMKEAIRGFTWQDVA